MINLVFNSILNINTKDTYLPRVLEELRRVITGERNQEIQDKIDGNIVLGGGNITIAIRSIVEVAMWVHDLNLWQTKGRKFPLIGDTTRFFDIIQSEGMHSTFLICYCRVKALHTLDEILSRKEHAKDLVKVWGFC